MRAQWVCSRERRIALYKLSSIKINQSIACLLACLLAWFSACLVQWLVGWFSSWLVRLLVGWLVGWLISWLVGSVAGWLVSYRLFQLFRCHALFSLLDLPSLMLISARKRWLDHTWLNDSLLYYGWPTSESLIRWLIFVVCLICWLWIFVKNQ